MIVPLVTVLAACWPRTIWYEHEFIAESLLLAAFVAVIALLLTPKIVESRLGFPLLMLAFVLLAGMKGAGRFLWIGSVLGLFLLYRDPRKWMWNKLSIALAGLSFLLVSTVGKSSQGDWLALSSSLPLVRTEGEPYSSYRSVLKGQILEARTYGNDYPWVMHDYKKRLQRKGPESFHPEWGLLRKGKNKQKFSKVARAFWLDAITAQPLRFFSMTVKTIGIALSEDSLTSRFAPSKFWVDMDQSVSSRWRRYPRYFDRLFGLNFSTYKLRLEQRSNATYSFMPALQFVSRHFSWLGRGPARLEGPIGSGGQGPFPSFSPRPLGVMALGGSVFGATVSKRRQQCIVLLLPLLLYLFGTFAVGDAVSRYLQPVEWIGFVFAGVCIDFLFRFADLFVDREGQSFS